MSERSERIIITVRSTHGRIAKNANPTQTSRMRT
jgi:hypothetical protein